MSTNGGTPTLGEKADKLLGAAVEGTPPADGSPTLNEVLSNLTWCIQQLAQRVVALEHRGDPNYKPGQPASALGERHAHAIEERVVHRMRGDLPPQLAKLYFQPAFDGLCARIFAIESRTNETRRQVADLVKESAPEALVERLVKPHFADVTNRLAAIETRSVLADAGIWNEKTLYRSGDVVTHDGSAFVCIAANQRARPGRSDVWRLMVKHGKDAKSR